MFLDEIKTRLVSVGGIAATAIFKSSSADIPRLEGTAGRGPYLVLIETGGTSASLTQGDTGTENPSMQISCRALDYAVARAELQKAYVALGQNKGLWNITLSGVSYLKIKAKQCITDIGEDDVGRPMVAFNIEAEKQPS